jgi:PAS domain S-box-containing protein
VEALGGGSAVAAIRLLDAEGRLWIGAAPSLPEAYTLAIDGLKARADLGTCSAAAVTRQVVITPDIAADPNWDGLAQLPLDLGLVAAWSQPIFASDGRVLGTFGTYFRQRRLPTSLERRLVETLAQTAALAVERHDVQAGIARGQRLLDRALEAADMCTWQYDPRDNMCEFSPRAQQLYGLPAGRFLHDEASVRDLIHPDDIPVMWEAVGRAIDPAGDGRYGVEYRVRRPEGGWRWLSVWGLADFEGEGAARRTSGLSGASRDITRTKEAERQQELLSAELSHRVKNNLAIVQAIATQTLRLTPEPAAFAETFLARIAALARAHNLLTAAVWQGALLSDLARTALQPFAPPGGGAIIRMDGPAVELTADTATTLLLVLHELAINAAKYGALTVPTGLVELGWTLGQPEKGGKRVRLAWRESGGPEVRQPDRRGFGSRLLRASLGQLQGEAQLDYAPQGLSCTLSFIAPS